MREMMLIMPEIFLALTLVFVIVGEITYHGERFRLIAVTALLGLGSAFVQSLIAYNFGAAQAFHQSLSIDGITFFFRILFISLAAISVGMSMHSSEIAPEKRSEYCALILASTLGMCLAASCADLLLAFLTLQFVNILAYFLAGFSKRSTISNEAAVKYMIFSAVSAGLLAYAMAILFGASHGLNIYNIHHALVENPLARQVLLVVFTLFMLSLSFQVGSFPMYFWTPDVIEGAPTPVSAFIGMGTRAAGFAISLRMFLVIFAQPTETPGHWQILGALEWPQMLALTSGLSMIIGSLLAIRQNSAKRMVGCLLVAQTGYLTMGLLVLDGVGVAALLYNLAIDLFSITGIFYVLSFLMNELHSDRLDDLRGMLRWAVAECIALILFMACLVGLPPLPGFIGKFALIGAALRQHWSVLAAVAIFSIALSTVAVARLSYSLIGDFRNPSSREVVENFSRKAFLAVLIIPMLLTGVFAEQILTWTVKSIGFILW